MNLIPETPDAKERLGKISKTGLWELRKRDPRFPRPVRLGRKNTYLESELDEYVALLAAERDEFREEA